MPTPWFYPTVITQFAEDDRHTPWLGVGDDFTTIVQVRTVTDLTTIANDLQLNNMKTKSYYLLLQGFDIYNVPNPISGIELYVDVRRGGRITDDSVILWYNGDNISSNRATGELSDLKIYGAPDDLWDTVPMINNLITSPQFGVLLRYQSNVFWPHKTTPNLQHVQLRFW
jgi:hypothetical protein